jgi:DNA N-6-adenine-methyltransferase (Dam)
VSAAVIPLAFDGGAPVAASLPALIDRASRRLIEARSSAEVLEAKHIAEAALHHAKVTRAAAETHADCLRIITRAEMRMAEEIDHGQANGTLARPGGDRQSIARSSGNASETLYRDLGIDGQRVSEWRMLRDAGPETVEEAIAGALSQGKAPTKLGIIKHTRGTLGTGNNEWFTPPQYIEAARRMLGEIDLDPASHSIAQQAVKAARFYTLQDDGLAREWHGRIWLNPPYAQPTHYPICREACCRSRERARRPSTPADQQLHRYEVVSHSRTRSAGAVFYAWADQIHQPPGRAVPGPHPRTGDLLYGARIRRRFAMSSRSLASLCPRHGPTITSRRH